jgi:glycosyltransferase involved in cell wall biosynthesis
MTAYNREKYVAEAIESVLASTFEEFELIIVDDCSTDRTVEIAKSYAARDSRVSVHVNEKNLGDYPNRNRAASLACGRYLKYVDSDDYLYPHGLAVFAKMMEQFPEAALGIAALLTDAERPYPFQLSPREAYQRHYFGASLFNRSPLSTIIRRKFFNAVGGFSGKRMVGDFELWHNLAACYPVVLLPQGVAWYRLHSEQEMKDFRTDLRYPFAYHCIALDQLMKPECPLLPSERAKAVRQVQRAQARAILRAATLGKGHCAWEMFRASRLSPAALLKAAVVN